MIPQYQLLSGDSLYYLPFNLHIDRCDYLVIILTIHQLLHCLFLCVGLCLYVCLYALWFSCISSAVVVVCRNKYIHI